MPLINTSKTKVDLGISDSLPADVNNRLANTLMKLQIGSSFVGDIIDFTNQGDAILATKYGNFIINNIDKGIKKGDTLILEVLRNHYSVNKISSQLVSINNNTNITNRHLQCLFIGDNHSNPNVAEQLNDKLTILPKDIATISRETINAKEHLIAIKGTVVYINLSKMNSSSVNYAIAKEINFMDKLHILLQPSPIKQNNFKNYFYDAELLGGEGKNLLLKTSFGVVEINSLHTEALGWLIDQKLSIIIERINDNKTTDIFKTPLNLTQDLFNDILPNFMKIQSLFTCLSNFARSDDVEHDHYLATKVKQSHLAIINDEELIEQICKKHSELKEITENISNIISQLKLSLTKDCEVNLPLNRWYQYPLLVDNEREESKQDSILHLQITDSSHRFLVNIPTQKGVVQLDGLLRIGVSSTKIESFSLCIRFEHPFIDNKVKRDIVEIFEVAQIFSEIKGELSFVQGDIINHNN